MNRLKEHRLRYGLSQTEAVEVIRRRALARGDAVVPGLDRSALSRHERGVKRPTPYYRALYCEVYGVTPDKLGFRSELPCEIRGYSDDVDRREFLASTTGFMLTAVMPSVPNRLGGDVAQLRESVTHLDKLADQHGGAGAVYDMTTRTFRRLRGLVEHASYGQRTGEALRELIGLTAHHAGWMAFDADRDDDARRWWLEATHWGRLAESDLVDVVTMTSMAVQASEQRRPREVIQLATLAQGTARRATPRLTSLLLARSAVGHAGAGDAASARAALRRARKHTETRHDDDPAWLEFFGPANFAGHEYQVALTLGDSHAAEDAARAAHALSDAVVYPRTHAHYMIRLADVLAHQRKIDESAAVASQALVAAADLDSARVTRGVADIARSLAPYRDSPGVGEFLDRARLQTV